MNIEYIIFVTMLLNLIVYCIREMMRIVRPQRLESAGGQNMAI